MGNYSLSPPVFFLSPQWVQNMASISNLAPTTELEAVNAMLSAIGEAPIDSLDTASATDVVMAVNILRTAAREVQTVGWRFNTEFGFRLEPSGTIEVNGYTLNVFTPPQGMLGYTLTTSRGQQGFHYADTSLRPSREYQQGGNPVVVFYDRENNCDGWLRDALYINPIWGFDFDMLPEVARRYITVLATRRFAAQVVGAEELVGFTQQDERLALRSLKREEGATDSYNLFHQASVSRFLGGRPLGPSGAIDWRGR